MSWLEMSRDEQHGGVGWGFGECLWSPTQRKGGGKWGYWELMKQVKGGDTVFHLREKPPKAAFVGFSYADSDGFETNRRPPELGPWEHADSFYRVPLKNFTLFPAVVPLETVFANKSEQLIDYHSRHSPASSANGRMLFYVQQAGRLQCQNGAYLSELDAELLQIVFELTGDAPSRTTVSVETGQQLVQVQARLGQQDFSVAVRNNFERVCCFPDCGVSDRELLVGSHIPRWADNAALRGDVANGLCLCLMHDRLFEIGYFTITSDHRVFIDTVKVSKCTWAIENLTLHNGQPIKASSVRPSIEALRYHWHRVKLWPDCLSV
jgi:hypothetical protein